MYTLSFRSQQMPSSDLDRYASFVWEPPAASLLLTTTLPRRAYMAFKRYRSGCHLRYRHRHPPTRIPRFHHRPAYLLAMLEDEIFHDEIREPSANPDDSDRPSPPSIAGDPGPHPSITGIGEPIEGPLSEPARPYMSVEQRRWPRRHQPLDPDRRNSSP